MINLLPPLEKQRLCLERKERLAVILGIIILAALISLSLILLAIKFYMLSETDYYRSALHQAQQEGHTPEMLNLTAVIKKYNNTLAQVELLYRKGAYFSRALSDLSDVPAPESLRFTNFSVSRNSKGEIVVDALGTSATRDDLLAFRKSVESNARIANPIFSPDSWVKPKNPNFHLTFTSSINENP